MAPGIASPPMPSAMPRRILIIQGHPDAGRPHLCDALAEAYSSGALAAGHPVEQLRVADLDFALLRSKAAYDAGPLPPSLAKAQDAIARADHLVLIYPLWLGCLPALLKGFLEQILRPGFAYRLPAAGAPGTRLLRGKTARVIVTMGMPAFVYRWYFGAHSLKNLRRNIFGLCGIRPVRGTLLGGVEARDGRQQRWIRDIYRLGERAA